MDPTHLYAPPCRLPSLDAMHPPVVGRFAPSPSGRMHLGNLFASLLAWLSCHAQGGQMVLRLEDLDTQRCLPSYSAQLEQDLQWLGLTWDKGGHAGGDGYFQRNRSPLYQQALDILSAQGLVYPCFCTRAELHAASAPHRSDGQAIYTGACAQLTAEERAEKSAHRSPAMRLHVPEAVYQVQDGHLGLYEENLAHDCGDFLLRRSDGMFAYQLAVVVDDGAMGVNEVVRGSDLLSSTPRQLYLYQLLGLTPPTFYHLPVLLSQEGRRLSKRDGDLGLDVLQAHFTPAQIIGKLAYLAGLNPTAAPVTAQDLVPSFHWSKVPTQDIVVPQDLFTRT